MSPHLCIASTTSAYPTQLWPYLNWALSAQAAGCQVTWLESLEEPAAGPRVHGEIELLRALLAPYGLGDTVAVLDNEGRDGAEARPGLTSLEAAAAADLLIDLAYLPPEFVRRFRRSVFVDLDPGQAQLWAQAGDLDISGHDVYVSIGEGVEAPGRPFPDAGYRWHYLPTPVALEAWPAAGPPPAQAPYTTISHWWDETLVCIEGRSVEASKRAGFEPFLALPQLTDVRLELVLGGLDDAEEEHRLQSLGWTVRNAAAVLPTPEAYRRFVYDSRGELSAAKPPYSLLQSGWLNDRTASYLAAGRPAVVQRTLRQEVSHLPEGEGLLRFDTVQEAAAALAEVEADYPRHAAAARAVAEAHFDGRGVVERVLELAL